MAQIIHVLNEHVLNVVASTVVKYYMLQYLCRFFKGIFDRPESIAPINGVTTSIGTFSIVSIGHFVYYQSVT